MTDAYVIEIGEEAIGLIVRDEEAPRQKNGFRFHASVKGFQSLEDKIFPNPESAKRAAILVVEQANFPA